MRMIILLFGDVALFYFALFFALSIRFKEFVSLSSFLHHAAPFTVLLPVFLFLLFLFNLYDNKLRLVAQTIFNTVFSSLFAFSAFSILFFYLLPIFGVTPKSILALFLIVLFVLEFFWKFYAPRILRYGFPKVFVVGSFVPREFDVIEKASEDISFDLFAKKLMQSKANRVVLSFTGLWARQNARKLHKLALRGIGFIDADMIKEDQEGYVDLNNIDELWFLKRTEKTKRQLFLFAKRVLDIVIAIILIPMYLIFLPFVAVVIKLQDGGKVFFVQKRIGLHGKVFFIYKFRTMTGADTGESALKSSLRVTTFGAFLRKSRIDELPQLWNILKGELSLIGPRPEIDELSNRYTKEIPFYSARYIVRPGLTGWAQVTHTRDPHHGLDIVATREKLSYDLYYIKHLSLFLELRIILKTARLLIYKIFTK